MSNNPHSPQGTPHTPNEGPSFQSPQHGQGQPPAQGYPPQGQYPSSGQGQGGYPGQGGYGQPGPGGHGQPSGGYGQPRAGAYGQQPPGGYGQQAPGGYGPQGGPGGHGPQGPGGHGPQGYGYDQPQQPEKRNILPFVAIGSIVVVVVLGVVAFLLFGGEEDTVEPEARPTDQVTAGPETPGGEEPGGENPGSSLDLPPYPETVGDYTLENEFGDTVGYGNAEFDFMTVTSIAELTKEQMAQSLGSPEEIGSFICGDAGAPMCVGEAHDVTVIISGTVDDINTVAVWGEEFLTAWQ